MSKWLSCSNAGVSRHKRVKEEAELLCDTCLKVVGDHLLMLFENLQLSSLQTILRTVQEKFAQGFLARECKAATGDADASAATAALRATLYKWYSTLSAAFAYYAVSVSSAPFFMGLNEFSALLKDCNIPDNEVTGCKVSDLDTIHMVCCKKVRHCARSHSQRV